MRRTWHVEVPRFTGTPRPVLTLGARTESVRLCSRAVDSVEVKTAMVPVPKLLPIRSKLGLWGMRGSRKRSGCPGQARRPHHH